MTSKKRKRGISQRDAEGILWQMFEDFVTDGSIDLRSVHAEKVWDKFLAHYSQSGRIDMDHYTKDFATWGPIASRIVELQMEKNAAAGV